MELAIAHLSKTYPNGHQALKDVSLTVPKGMFGLLGPNGAGKSTLMRTIATLQEADSGSIRLGDIDVLAQKDEVRKTLGYLPQEFGVYPNVTAQELLDHFAVLKGITARRARKEIVAALLQQTNLHDVRKKKLGSFSGGMRQRFGIAVALLGNPDADHRRRADRRTRSGGARALPEPAQRARRERHRHPLDAHRRGRQRAVLAHGDHQRGPDPAGDRAARRDRPPAGPGVEEDPRAQRAAGVRARAPSHLDQAVRRPAGDSRPQRASGRTRASTRSISISKTSISRRWRAASSGGAFGAAASDGASQISASSCATPPRSRPTSTSASSSRSRS